MMIRKLYDNTVGHVTNTGATSDVDYDNGEDVSSLVECIAGYCLFLVHTCIFIM